MASNQNETDEENDRSGWPIRDPRFWLSVSLTLLCLLLAFLLFSGWYVFESDKFPGEAEKRVEIFWRIGAGFIALITFTTVVWRGMMTDQQVNLQREQINQIIRQNDANDNASYVDLLMEGTKLLNQEGDSSKRAAIAALATVIGDPKRRYSIQALDSIGSEWRQNSTKLEADNYLQRIRDELLRADDMGLRSSIHATFKTEDQMSFWRSVRGFASQSYRGGVIQNFGHASATEDLSANVGPLFEIQRDPFSEFMLVTIIRSFITDDIGERRTAFFDCDFKECKIGRISRATFAFNQFSACCFSGAEIYAGEDDVFGSTALSLTKEKFAGSYYDVATPPRAEDGFSDWALFLQPKILEANHWFNAIPDQSGGWTRAPITP
ncbi:hypothetical protein V6767_12945 [Martelella sp. FLE1502]